MKIEDINTSLWLYRRLMPIAKRISSIDLRECNHGITDRLEKKRNKLIAEAEEITEQVGLKIYHQGDPRGCSLYIIDDTMDSTTYNRGIAINI